MTLSYTQLTGEYYDGQGNAQSGSAQFEVNVSLYSSGTPALQAGVPITAEIINGQLKSTSGGTFQLADLASTVTIEGSLTGFWFYTVTETVGGQALPSWSFFLEHSGTPVDLHSLANQVQSTFANPMEQALDLIIGGAGGAPERLASPGGTTDYLRADGTWNEPPGGGGGSGTVTQVSGQNANGLTVSVANPTSTPAVTVGTSVTGLLKGNGTSVAAAVAGTDYLTPAGNGSQLTGLTQSQISGLVAALALLAPLLNPTFTGTVTVPTTVNATDAAQKAYVDSVAQGLDNKPSVTALAASNITLSGTQTIDGVAVTAGQRVLATGQSTASQNGLWVVASGAWTRPADFASGSSQLGASAFVEGGTTYGSSGWVLTGTSPVTVDTTAETWTQFSGAGEINAGSGLSKAGNTLSLALTSALITAAGGALLASPALTGTPTAPTQSAGDDSTRLATTAYADTSSAIAQAAAEAASDPAGTAAAATAYYQRIFAV